MTPYVGIHSVPPSSSVLVGPGRHSVRKYWEFNPDLRIHYRTDAEYEEHFRAVLFQAVQRRLRADSPVLAELSGGMDSSSIVCVADRVIEAGSAEAPRVDTVSYFDDSEPNWDEYPYFTKVEDKRGRVGCHIKLGAQGFCRFDLPTDRLLPTPGATVGNSPEITQQFASCIASCGSRVLLSGIGGDEATGGVPTPTPELADLLATAQLKALARQLKRWALNQRKPWFFILLAAVREFFPPDWAGLPEHKRPLPWLHKKFVQKNRTALRGYESRVRLDPLPSFQTNLNALNAVRRQLVCDAVPRNPPYEVTYPFLDRCLLEFLFAIPRDQVIRPGQRRSLMRRSLAGIVPDEILGRKRKAYLARAPLLAIAAMAPDLVQTTQSMLSSRLEIVDAERFLEALQNNCTGQAMYTIGLIRTITLELWLRHLNCRNFQFDAQ
jgi:asparagine synthase (glutamine-hydrolysing)